MMAGASPFSGSVELGEVLAVNDPDTLGRVKVRFISRGDTAQNDADRQDATPWALVAAPFAGPNMGAFFIPHVGSRVILGCLNNDWRFPVVLGSVWHGEAAVPETHGGENGTRVDKWSLTGRNGTRIAIVEDGEGKRVEITTSDQRSVIIDEDEGTMTLTSGSSTVTLSDDEVAISTGTMKIEASKLEVTAPQSKFDCATSDFSGAVFSDTEQTNSIIASSYTPSAGNMM